MSSSRSDHQNNSKKLTGFGRSMSTTLTVLATYPFLHPFTALLLRWMLSKYSPYGKSLKESVPHIYEILLKNKYEGKVNIPRHIKTLYQGYITGKIYKFFQANLRYPTKKFYHDLIRKHARIPSEDMAHVLSGSMAGMTEAILHPIDTVRNVAISSKPPLTLEQQVVFGFEKGRKLWRGVEFTLMRNSIGGAVQFGVFECLLKYGFAVENKQQLNYIQVILCSAFAAATMVFATQPFANRKAELQVAVASHIPVPKLKAGDLLNFRGAVSTMCTKGLTPTVMLAGSTIVGDLLSKFSIFTTGLTSMENQNELPRPKMGNRE